MCSSAGDIEDITNSSSGIHKIFSKELLQKCKKCQQKSCLLLQKKDPFCKLCFYEYCNHKFRSTIGKSKKIKHGDKVLLACSGGRKSATLLHMTKQTLKSASLKQISFTPGILFIEDSCIIPDVNKDAQLDVISALKEFKRSDYPVLYSSLDKVYKINTGEILYSTVSDDLKLDNSFSENELKLKENFKDMPLSSKIDLLKHLRLLLVTEISKQAGYDFVFVGDTASLLAVELLSDIALGRGSQIFSDTSFYDTRYKVPICRPLREFLNKEISLYNYLHSVPYEVFPDFLTKTPPNSCIQRLTETFLSNLQENFPATIFTVFRTGSKLSKSDVTINRKTCIICMSPLDNKNSDLCSALEALKISEKLSVHSSQPTSVTDTSEKIMQFLCHGCSMTFKRMMKPEDFHSLIPESTTIKMESCHSCVQQDIYKEASTFKVCNVTFLSIINFLKNDEAVILELRVDFIIFILVYFSNQHFLCPIENSENVSCDLLNIQE